MKKTITLFAMLFAIIGGLGNAYAQTNVSGGIYSNTTWTKANSPYIVTDTVVVFPGVTLTIEPGVVVKFDDNIRLEIRQATLIAQGTAIDSITFTSNTVTPTAGIWSEIYLNDCPHPTKFIYCNFKYAQFGIGESGYDTLYVKNSSFNNNNVGIGTYYSPLIDSCIFTNNNEGISCDIAKSISNCTFNNNFLDGVSIGDTAYIYNCNFINNTNYGIYVENGGINGLININNSNFLNNFAGINNFNLGIGESMPFIINNCRISKNQTGVLDTYEEGDFPCGCYTITNCILDSNYIAGLNIGGGTITNCEIEHNGTGLYGNNYISSYIFTMNVVENNNIGILLKNNYGYDSIYCNKICNNTTYNLYDSIVSGSNISIPNNYWCTTDSSVVASLIYDGYNNVNMSLVNFMPIDTVGCYLTGCALNVTAKVTNATCDTCHNGSATGQVAYGFPPYTWTWYTSPIQTTQTATGLKPGTYTLCVTDSKGCSFCNHSIFIDSTNCAGFSIAAYSSNVTCSACNNGSAWVNVTGGTPPYHYTWYTNPMLTDSIATGLTHGTYHVCVTDLYGCIACDSVTVSTGNCSAYFYLYPDTATPHHYYAVNMASGVPPISYYWSWGDGMHDTIAYPNHTYAAAGFYTICLSIIDSAGCTNTYCDSFYLQKTTNTMITVDVIPNTITGIKEVNNSRNNIQIYPNPASEEIQVISNQLSVNSIEIYNLLGEKIYSTPITDNRPPITINVAAFAKGLYFLEVENENGVAVKKFEKE